MLAIIEKNRGSDDFLKSEYLLSVIPVVNQYDTDIFKLITNKYIYKLILPYNKKYTDKYGCIHLYKKNIKTICTHYNIDMKYYYTGDNNDKNILPYDDLYKYEVGKYLILADYTHNY